MKTPHVSAPLLPPVSSGDALAALLVPLDLITPIELPSLPGVCAGSVAEAVSGDTGRADFDILHSRGQIRDALHSGDGPLAESLRPVFIDYLRKHPDV